MAKPDKVWNAALYVGTGKLTIEIRTAQQHPEQGRDFNWITTLLHSFTFVLGYSKWT